MIDGRPGCPLSSSVLVLNRSWVAVHVITVRRAFALLYGDAANVIDVVDESFAMYNFSDWCELSEFRALDKERHDDWIRSVQQEILAPRVIRLHQYDKVPRLSLRFNRRNLLARDDHRCQYCGDSFPNSQLSLDHVLPRSRGGDNSWENVVCSCLPCNSRKGDRTPREARMKLKRQPKRPSHSPILAMKVGNPKYRSWRSFLNLSDNAINFG